MMCDVSGQTFGKRVAARRLEQELSVRQAARLSGVSETAWHNIERGRELRRGVRRKSPRPPQKTTVIKIARLLGWPADQALRWAGYDEPVTSESLETRANTFDPRQQLSQCLKVLSDSQVLALLHVARTMTDPHAAVPNHTTPRPGSVTIDRIPRGEPTAEVNNHNGNGNGNDGDWAGPS